MLHLKVGYFFSFYRHKSNKTQQKTKIKSSINNLTKNSDSVQQRAKPTTIP